MPILSDTKLIKQWEKHKNISQHGNAKQHRKDKQNYAFHHGNEASYKATVEDRGRKRSVTFNKVKPFVDAVTGFAIQLRRKPDYLARIQDNKQQMFYSTSMCSIADYVRQTAYMDQIETRQDRDMFIAGWGVTDMDISYENNPDGDVVLDNKLYHEYFWDPQSFTPNLRDRRWDYSVKVYNIDEALQRFKGTVPDDFERDDKRAFDDYVWNPYGGEYDKISETDGFSTTNEELAKVYKYQWYTLEKYWRCKNPLYEVEDSGLFEEMARLVVTMKQTRLENSSEDYEDDIEEFDPSSEWLIMSPTIKADMELLFEKFGFDVDYQSYLRRCYYTAIITKKRVLKKYKTLHQKGFTTNVKTGSFDPDRKLWFGLVDSLKEPAKYSNKALTEILYIIASNSKGGVMYEESAIDDTARFEHQYAKSGAAIKVNDGALSKGQIQPKATPKLDSGYEGIYQISMDSLIEVSGINKEFLGLSDTAEPSGVLEAQRITKVLSTLADYFDSIGFSQVESAKLVETFSRVLADNSEGRLISLLGPDGSKQYMALSKDKFADEYDVEIGEAPSSPAQRNLTQKITTDLANVLFTQGINIWDVAVDYLPIKQADKQKIKQKLAPNPEAEKMQQQMTIKKFMDESTLNAAIAKGQEAQAQKSLAEAALSASKVEQVKSTVVKDHATTGKTIQEAEHISLENNILKKIPHNAIEVKV